MSNIRKQNTLPINFTIRSGLLSGARMLQVTMNLIVVWLFSIFLDKEVYGNFQKVFVCIGLIASIIPIGLPSLISSLPYASFLKLLYSMWQKTKWIHFSVLIITIVSSFWLIEFSPSFTRILLILLAVLNAFYVVVEIMCIKQHKDKAIFILNILYAFAFLLVHLYFLYGVAFNINSLLINLIIISLCRLLLSSLLFKKHLKVNSISDGSFKTDSINSYVHQWKFLGVNELLDAFSKQIDKLFLLWLLSAEAYAIYFNGSYEIPLLGVLVSAIGTFINLQISQSKLDDKKILSLFHNSCIGLACILFPLFFFLQFNAQDLFNIVFRNRYPESATVFLVSSYIIPLRIANYTSILQSKLKSDIIFKGSIIGLISKIIFCIILYQFWGILGVAAAIVLGTIVQIIFYLIYSAHILDVKKREILPYKQLLILFGLSGFICWVNKNIIKINNSNYQVLAGGILMVFLILILLYFYYRKILKVSASFNYPEGGKS